MFFNTKDYEWSDVRVFLAGSRVVKLTGIKYKVTRDMELLYAEGDHPLAVQRGNKGYAGELRILCGALNDLNRAAIVAGAEDITDLDFEIVVEYKLKGSRPIQIDTLVNVAVQEFEKSIMQGDKKMEVVLPFLFTGLKPKL